MFSLSMLNWLYLWVILSLKAETKLCPKKKAETKYWPKIFEISLFEEFFFKEL
jgi:hypothetical protein